MPPSFNRYFEPFLGGGALFFALAPANGFISDSNSELIHCYKIVRDHPEELIDFLRQMNVTAAEFYRVRAIEPETLPSVPRAARFIYLNKTCFNGVYRVNKKGRFNTPFGHCEKVTLVDSDNLRRASRLISNVTLLSEDYQKFLPLVQAKDFVYLDPPYLPIGKYSDFKRYTKEFFYEHDHRSLACVCEQLHQNGSYFLLSNSFHDTIKNLYSGFHQVSVAMPRSVNCNGLGRGNVRELLISNYPLPFAQ